MAVLLDLSLIPPFNPRLIPSSPSEPDSLVLILALLSQSQACVGLLAAGRDLGQVLSGRSGAVRYIWGTLSKAPRPWYLEWYLE